MASQGKRSRSRLMFLIGLTIAAAGFLPVPDRAWEAYRAWRSDEGISVLFIGNSFTFTHDLPGMLAELSREGETEPALVVTSEVYPNATLEGHWQRGDALQRIHERAWNYVVLQEQSFRPIAEYPLMREYARRFLEEIQASGATPLLYLTWADLDRPEEQRLLTMAYEAVAIECGVRVVPVGLAWEKALRLRPEIRLHAADSHHPSATGTYLSACVFYAAITGEHPSGLPCEVCRKPKLVWQFFWPGRKTILTQDTAGFLQDVAGETVLSSGDWAQAGRQNTPVVPAEPDRQGLCNLQAFSR